MTTIDYALNDAMRRIPREVLNLSFMDKRGPKVRNLKSLIHTLVVRPYILVDINLLSANTVYIPINKCKLISKDDIGMIYEVPKSLTGGRSIVSPLSIAEKSSTDTMITAGKEEYIDIITSIQLIAENTISILTDELLPPTGYLACTVEYSSKLNELPPGARFEIAKFIILGIKMWIHNEMSIKLEMGYVYNGAELTTIRSKIEEYGDTEAAYDEQREFVIAKVLHMADASTMRSTMSALFGA